MGTFSIIFCTADEIPSPGDILAHLAQHGYPATLLEDEPGTLDLWSDAWSQIVITFNGTEEQLLLLDCSARMDEGFDAYIQQWIDLTYQGCNGCNFLAGRWRKQTIQHLNDTRYFITIEFSRDIDIESVVLLINYLEENFGGLATSDMGW